MRNSTVYGMEEVPVISMLQELHGSEIMEAKLIKTNGIEWETNFAEK